MSARLSRDSAWLFALDEAGRVHVWDLASGRLIDRLSFHSPATALALSPTGEFLATAHAHSPGVFLWTNRSLFCPQFAMRAIAPVPLSFPRQRELDELTAFGGRRRGRASRTAPAPVRADGPLI